MIVNATLGGVPLSLGAGHVWALQYGVRPYQRTFTSTRVRIKEILAKPNPLTLIVEAPGYPRLTVRGLHALHEVPVDENDMGVVVVDSRWTFTRKALTRDYNVRRTTGDRRRIGDDLQLMEIQDVIGDFIYRYPTLRDGRPWDAREILADVLDELVGSDGYVLGTTQFDIDIEGLVLDRDRGDAGLARVLSYIPGAQVYAGIDGRIYVTDQFDGSEEAAIRGAGSRYWDLPGQVELIKRHRLRPKVVKVQIEPEPEMRFNYDEDNSSPTMVKGREPRIMHNVIPVVDPTLTLDGKTVTQGTYLTIQDWLTAVAAEDDAPAKDPKKARGPNNKMPAITMLRLREHFMSGFQLLVIKYTQAHLDAPSVLWQRRFAVLAQHYRQTFRILPQWMDKLRGIKSIRASILDQETGSRGKAEAYFDHFVVPRRRNLAKRPPHNTKVGQNIPGYAEDLTGQHSSPAEVAIIDADSGIFHLAFRTDLWGDGTKVAPGLLDIDAEELMKQVATASPTTFTSIAAKLRSGWNLAVVLTVSTAVPNNSSRLYEVEIPASAAYGVLGKVTPARLEGPDWTVGISAGVATARFMWRDQSSALIEETVYGTGKPWAYHADDLLVDKDATDAIAVATAARVYALLQDRWEGEQFIALAPSMLPTGSMSNVAHIVTSGGSVVTRMSLPPLLQAPDVYSTLPDGARKILQRKVQQ